MRTDQIIEAIVEMPSALVVEAALAGSKHSITIGSTDFELTLPGLADWKGDAVVAAPEFDSVKQDIDWRFFFREDYNPWGMPRSWKGESRDAACTTSFDLARVKIHKTFAHGSTPRGDIESLGATLFEKAESWLARAIDWMGIIVGSNLLAAGLRVEQSSTHVWGHDGTAYTTLSDPKPGVITVTLQDAVTIQTWKRGLAGASTGAPIPPEYLFLASARIANSEGDYRRAVLDAATATEIAMAKLLDTKLSTSDSSAAALVRKRWQQISGLSQALSEFGVALPSDIRGAGLAEPRNRAIHGGTSPSNLESRRAIEIATTVLELATPVASIV